MSQKRTCPVDGVDDVDFDSEPFQSDFKKIFNKTPGKWLTEKRLNLAHHKLKFEKQKSTDVFLCVGFENLSHFSFAFKKAFGYNPSSLSDNVDH